MQIGKQLFVYLCLLFSKENAGQKIYLFFIVANARDLCMNEICLPLRTNKKFMVIVLCFNT